MGTSTTCIEAPGFQASATVPSSTVNAFPASAPDEANSLPLPSTTSPSSSLYWKALPIVVAKIWRLLTAKEKYVLATLFSLRPLQAEALCENPSTASMDKQHDTDLLNFRLRHADRGTLSRMYTNRVMNAGTLETLQWWKDSGLELRYSKYSIDWLVGGHDCLRRLQWWKDSGLELRYTAQCLDVVQWWHDSGLPMLYSERAMDRASSCGKLEVLEWCKQSGNELTHSQNGMNHPSSQNIVTSVEWWKKSGLPLKYTTGAYTGQVGTAIWKRCSGGKRVGWRSAGTGEHWLRQGTREF
ncbi:hypothetical protein DFJ73DRAFT_24274 [Zopfochytrium polystomum]|nr:hypothetical protein DFJ73DRAFT_24274 [Zopfochytrium polystomum]